MKDKNIIDWKTLWENPETQKAVESLKKKGVSDSNINELLRQILNLPMFWKSLDEESPEARAGRRDLLAEKIRTLAKEIEKDYEAKNFRIIDHKTVSQTNFNNRPTISDFLHDFADLYEIRKIPDDSYSNFLKGKATTRNKLKEYVQREVSELLLTLLNYPENNPRADAARLCNAVLNTNTVTSENMKDIFDYLRKKKGGGN